MPDEYASEREYPTLPPCGNLRLVFDGRELRFFGGKRTHIYPAVSGKMQTSTGSSGGTWFDYSQQAQRGGPGGPIPEGDYRINPAQLSSAGLFRNTDAWGLYRITIHPLRTTQTWGRGGFFIHGGVTPGSSGCIDLTYHITRFADDLKAEVGVRKISTRGAEVPIGLNICEIPLRVWYREKTVKLP